MKKKKGRTVVKDSTYYMIWQDYDIDSHTWSLSMQCKKCRGATREPLDIERRYCGVCHIYLPEY